MAQQKQDSSTCPRRHGPAAGQPCPSLPCSVCRQGSGPAHGVGVPLRGARFLPPQGEGHPLLTLQSHPEPWFSFAPPSLSKEEAPRPDPTRGLRLGDPP